MMNKSRCKRGVMRETPLRRGLRFQNERAHLVNKNLTGFDALVR
jgi:hypothetical protein